MFWHCCDGFKVTDFVTNTLYIWHVQQLRQTHKLAEQLVSFNFSTSLFIDSIQLFVVQHVIEIANQMCIFRSNIHTFINYSLVKLIVICCFTYDKNENIKYPFL